MIRQGYPSSTKLLTRSCWVSHLPSSWMTLLEGISWNFNVPITSSPSVRTAQLPLPLLRLGLCSPWCVIKSCDVRQGPENVGEHPIASTVFNPHFHSFCLWQITGASGQSIQAIQDSRRTAAPSRLRRLPQAWPRVPVIIWVRHPLAKFIELV